MCGEVFQWEKIELASAGVHTLLCLRGFKEFTENEGTENILPWIFMGVFEYNYFLEVFVLRSFSYKFCLQEKYIMCIPVFTIAPPIKYLTSPLPCHGVYDI